MLLRLLSAAFLGLALSTAGCRHTYQQEREPSKEQKLELYSTTAIYLYEDDDLERAQEQAVKALEVEPENRAMRRMIGWIRLRKNGNQDLIVAERFFRDLRREGDENENTALGLAITCERMGKAYDDVSRALTAGEREPEKGKDRAASARELAAKARSYWQESIRLCDEILAAGEGNTNAMNALQRVHALAGNYEKSLGWSTRLLERTAAELTSWRRMLQEKELTEREETLFRNNERAALDLQTDTHIFVATLLFRLQRYEEALAHLDAVVDDSPGLAHAYSLRGQMRARAGQYEGAVADLDRYLALSDSPYEHPDVQRAFELRAEAQKHVGGPLE
ncbi:MAG: tetratricopeptide repeat protein [Planctomycetes bacterium]|nr:tetratricopeptide repeat protein [Planctomycetota bacterium]